MEMKAFAVEQDSGAPFVPRYLMALYVKTDGSEEWRRVGDFDGYPALVKQVSEMLNKSLRELEAVERGG